jgi:hypothetical protein
VPDEAFEELWKVKGGPDMVAMHQLFGGATLPAEEVRAALALSPEQFRTAGQAARRVGLVEGGDERISFILFAPDSAQHGRLEWCLESHQAELPPIVTRLRSLLLLRYLATPPGHPA